MSNIFGRQVVILATNKSGGGVVPGDVVIIDTANNDAFTTTTSASTIAIVGIAQETIASNATGRVLIAGYASLVNVNASVTRGHYGATHTVAKQAADAGTSRAAGTFCQFLTGGTTPTATIWPTDLGAGSGAPTTATYVTTAAEGALSAETVRQNFANFYPEASGYASGTGTDEFDDASFSGWTLVGTGLVSGDFDETSFPGYVVMTIPSGRNATQIAYKSGYSGGDFTLYAKMQLAYDAADASLWGIQIVDTSGNGVMGCIGGGSTGRMYMRNVASNADLSNVTSLAVDTISPVYGGTYYLKLTKASGVYTFGMSRDGLAYTLISGTPTAFTAARIAFGRTFDAGTATQRAVWDYVRSSA